MEGRCLEPPLPPRPTVLGGSSLLYTYVLTDGGAVMGQQMAITSAVIAGLLVFFSWYSRFMTLRGVLR